MAGKSSQSNNRGSALFGYFVSGKDKQYHTNEFAAPFTSTGLTATGGLISDYTSGTDVYRAHIFTSSGEFDVSAIGTLGDTVEYLVVAGGGAGGGVQPGSTYHGAGGGGGAGGLRTNLSGHPLAGAAFPVSVSPYTVTVGGGGQADTGSGAIGSDSVFGSITSSGGGGGAGGVNPSEPGAYNGGSGGGGSRENNTAGTGNTPASSPSQGNSGGTSSPGGDGGGGGGAGHAGRTATNNTNGGDGGIGVQVLIAGPPTNTGIGATGASGGVQYFAGGGGGGKGGNPDNQTFGIGGAWNGTSVDSGPLSGGGNGGNLPNQPGENGAAGTGGGGGGAGAHPSSTNSYAVGGFGGSGIVVVRYKIGTVDTSNAKATGGSVSFYNSGSGLKTIHTFTGSGEFTAPGSFNETLEYVIIGGGGAGGGRNYRGGGGGAGAVRHGTTAIDNTGPGNPSTTTVQVGAGGVYVAPEGPNGNGTSSFFGSPITSPGGGMGSGYEVPYAGITGGSGGGAGGYPGGSNGAAGTDPGPATGDSYPGDPADTSPANGWGYRGGGRGTEGAQQGGGGGGAGGQGIPSDSGDYPSTYGYGGPGIQLPATFRDPRSAPGGTGGTGPHGPGDGGGLGYQSPGGTGWYVAGGGNGGGYSKPSGVNPSVITFVPAGGGGRGAINGPGNSGEPEHVYRNNGWPGAVNSGSGGGGASPAYGQDPGQGGSGLVLIAYPT